ncbi:MarR family winged helix-turn-helix transcriptional regulator [Gryllotalpicola protaetiae]|uniref:MarR family transcriptional regulator n=1 Tax=Gryllotalpicola protaetiae TaxID=2419771 RepID=A0A387BJD2_9MICO|nr:MarR family transcriptional regulator [Gryllotalpicola protaetiae]AYG02828.1 MarR family transcriptional regulator [Gryllotalpicola protaetiae]
MSEADRTEELAVELMASITVFVAAARKANPAGGLSAAEISALLRIKRAGETTSAAVARLEGISPQAMGATIAALEARSLVEREKDADDGRRILLRATDAGRELLDARRDSRTHALAHVLAERFDDDELATLGAAAPLLERLAEGL